MQAPTDTAIAAQPATPPNFDVPADACDCHTHIFGDPQSFPFFAGRVYTPPTALPDEMAAVHRALRIRRVVIVTPSVYGTDNSATLYGLRARGADARGVAVIDEKTSQRDLDALAAAGVCGIRLNLSTDGKNDPALARQRLVAMLPRASARNWHVQIFTNFAVCAHHGAGAGRAGAGRARSFRRRAGGARAGAARLRRPGRAGALRQSLCEDFRRLPGIARGAGLSGRGAARQGADRRQSGTGGLGYRLAAYQLHHTPGARGDRRHAILGHRRRAADEPAAALGSRCGDPPGDPGRHPGPPLRILSTCRLRA